jgi:hypothetical protein
LGSCHLGLGECREAAESLEKAVSFNRSLASVVFQLLKQFFNESMPKEAEENWKGGKKILPA